MSSLVVLALSDSFSAAWPVLAAECGLTLEIATSPADFQSSDDAVGIIAAGGEEARLEATFRQMDTARMEVAAVGALASHRLAGAVTRAGAAEFFALTDDFDLLRSWVRERAEWLRAREQRGAFAERERTKYNFDGILGESRALHAALDIVARVIPHASVTVLITGETGSGKELVARALHYNGPRREAPFEDINCTALPDQLLESELFGHEKGAFTDASSQKIGLFEYANGGTLFLDEVGHLPLALQGKMLRALEERQVRRVGGMKSIPIDVRVVAATNLNLLAAVRRGDFREDLYYRLNVVAVELPPLRARPTDIPLLAKHFLARFAAEYGVSVPPLSAITERALMEREWLGNIRELRNTLERAVLLGLEALESPDPSGTSLSLDRAVIPFPAPLQTVVRAAAQAMLALCGDNKTMAARRLGISRTRLQRVLDGAVDEESPHVAMTDAS